MKDQNIITINGIDYVPVSKRHTNTDGLVYSMVRTYSAGVFAGYYKRGATSKEATVYEAKRIHFWEGAASLSELAQRGTSLPEKCRIPMPVSEVYLTEVIEVIPMTKGAIETLNKVPVWTR